uniref:Uncharacterized protein n=1 Tax=Tanacetum cinerariifolium TaxID=118510 RepID=A0A6L2NRZ5_TANCI|nr:hypothetical protein [Tanacetum cinerariifolium]
MIAAAAADSPEQAGTVAEKLADDLLPPLPTPLLTPPVYFRRYQCHTSPPPHRSTTRPQIGDKRMVAAVAADSPEQAVAVAEKLADVVCVFIIYLKVHQKSRKVS